MCERAFREAGPGMSKRKPLVMVTRKLPDVVETRMMELFNTRLNANDEPMSKAELIEAAKSAEVSCRVRLSCARRSIASRLRV